jgi:hypothetical protein
MLYEPLDSRKMGEFDHLTVVLLSDPGFCPPFVLLLMDLQNIVGEKEKS